MVPVGRPAFDFPALTYFSETTAHRTAYITQTMVGPTIPLYEAYSPAAAQVDSEHVFQVAWNDIVSSGMAPEAAADKALKRAQEIFAKYPITQS